MDKIELEWRKAIADQVRRNCTPSSEAYAKGGDTLVHEVADWIVNPPDFSKLDRPKVEIPKYSILERSSASRTILRWNEPLTEGAPGWWSEVADMNGHEWDDAVRLLRDLMRVDG